VSVRVWLEVQLVVFLYARLVDIMSARVWLEMHLVD